MSTVMPTVDTTKKASHPGDWHPADIKAALEKAGWSLRSLSIAHDYDAKSLSSVMRKPWPRAERIVGEAINYPPQRIWPSRYHADGTPKSGRGERGLGRPAKRTPSRRRRHAGARDVNVKGAA